MSEDTTTYDGQPVRQPTFSVLDEANRAEIKLDLEIIDTLMAQRKLRPPDVVVYLTLRAFGKNGKEDVFPNQGTIGNRCGLNRETVAASIKRLEEHDLIRVIPRFDSAGRKSDLYRILPVTIPPSDKSKWKYRKPPRLPKTKKPVMEKPLSEKPTMEKPALRTKQVEEEQKEDTNVSSRTAIDPAKALVLALYNDVLGLDGPTAWPKAMRQAKSLVAAGCTPEEVRAIGRWLMGDSFWSSKGIDMGAIQSQRDKWRATQAKVAPSNPRQPQQTEADPYWGQMLAGLEGEE